MFCQILPGIVYCCLDACKLTNQEEKSLITSLFLLIYCYLIQSWVPVIKWSNLYWACFCGHILVWQMRALCGKHSSGKQSVANTHSCWTNVNAKLGLLQWAKNTKTYFGKIICSSLWPGIENFTAKIYLSITILFE